MPRIDFANSKQDLHVVYLGRLGQSVSEIAKETNLSPKAVRLRLKKAGVVPSENKRWYSKNCRVEMAAIRFDLWRLGLLGG